LGAVFHASFTFHNAYGPDKAWYFDRALSGGGCGVDLGIHLIDAALWLLEDPPIERVSGSLFAKGARVRGPRNAIEDYLSARLELENGALVDITCSWNLPAGRDAVIELDLHGSEGGASFRNVNGSFYDFRAEELRGTRSRSLAEPPDDWGGRALSAWIDQLQRDPRFDPSARHYVRVAQVLDRIYKDAVV
jgi:predicted dehydrogenase